MAKYPTDRSGDVDNSIRPPTQHRYQYPSTSGTNPYRVFTRWVSRIRQPHVGTSPSGHLYLPTTDHEHSGSAIRSGDLGQRFTAGSTGIRLPLTPETESEYQPDSILDYDHINYLDSKTRLRERRRRRNWYIIWSSVVTSLLVLVYALDVERSWTAIERQWADVSLPHKREGCGCTLTEQIRWSSAIVSKTSSGTGTRPTRRKRGSQGYGDIVIMTRCTARALS